MKDDTYYFYPRDKNGNRLWHSIVVIMKEGRPFLGYAQLSENDRGRFNKKIGRAIAESRALKQLSRFLESRARSAAFKEAVSNEGSR